MYSYNGTDFSKELNCSLEDFERDYADNPSFRDIPHTERPAELKKVWKAVMKENGNSISTSRKSVKPKTEQGKS